MIEIPQPTVLRNKPRHTKRRIQSEMNHKKTPTKTKPIVQVDKTTANKTKSRTSLNKVDTNFADEMDKNLNRDSECDQANDGMDFYQLDEDVLQMLKARKNRISIARKFGLKEPHRTEEVEIIVRDDE